MALILKNGAIFLHVPKTGGRWVTRVLTELGLVAGKLGHMHADVERILSPRSASGLSLIAYLLKRRLGSHARTPPFMFCFVRHPLAWYESYYKYNSEAGVNWRNEGDINDIQNWHPNAALNGLGASDFNGFIRNVVRKHPGYVTEMYSQFATPQVSFVGRQENLCDDLIAVLRMTGAEFPEDFIRQFEKVGVAKYTGEPIVWDPDLKAEMLRLEYAGLVRWGYAPRRLDEDNSHSDQESDDCLPALRT